MRGFSVFQNDLGQCEIAAVSETQVDMSRSHTVGVVARYAVKNNRRPAARLARYFDIAPAYAFAPAGAQCLHRRFFGSKTCGVAFCWIAMTFTVGDFTGSKNAIEEDAAVAADHFPNPADLLHVHTQADDHVTLFSLFAPGSKEHEQK